ncbi:hypothetical protein HHI36_019740 [Cryptolaemus montrouzieri]|uniref:Uncharacterized protein n=1 Tax=Cryptolaemus montrouzieri TaxID=559131 RepID=A0ABD2N890_9CUCU
MTRTGGNPGADQKLAVTLTIREKPMDMEKHKNHVIESLSGDSHCMSGASDGHDSIQNISGRVVRSRAPVAQIATASQLSQQRSQTRTRTQPVDGSAHESQPALTQAELPRQRMKWTGSMNEPVMRIMCRVTRLEQEMVSYRQQLHEEFSRIYPDLKISEQRITNQYRIDETLQPGPSNQAQMQDVRNKQNQEDNAELRDNLIRGTGAKIHTKRDISRETRQLNTLQWERRLTKKIEVLRRDIEQLTKCLRDPKV